MCALCSASSRDVGCETLGRGSRGRQKSIAAPACAKRVWCGQQSGPAPEMALGYGEKELLCCSPVPGKAAWNRPAIKKPGLCSHVQKLQPQCGETESVLLQQTAARACMRASLQVHVCEWLWVWRMGRNKGRRHFREENEKKHSRKLI